MMMKTMFYVAILITCLSCSNNKTNKEANDDRHIIENTLSKLEQETPDSNVNCHLSEIQRDSLIVGDENIFLIAEQFNKDTIMKMGDMKFYDIGLKIYCLINNNLVFSKTLQRKDLYNSYLKIINVDTSQFNSYIISSCYIKYYTKEPFCLTLSIGTSVPFTDDGIDYLSSFDIKGNFKTDLDTTNYLEE